MTASNPRSTVRAKKFGLWFALSSLLRHHGRERERDDAGDEHRPGKRERKLAEERARQTALKADRSVDRRERNRHRDDGSDELARPDVRRLHGRFALADVSLHVLDDDDRVIHDETHREHDREEREQIQREAEDPHQEHRANEGKQGSQRAARAPCGVILGTRR